MNVTVQRTIKALAQRTLPLCLCCFVVLGAATPAFSQSRDLVNRVSRLENEVDTLNRAVYKGERPPAPVSEGAASETSDLLLRVQQLEGEIRNLTGKVEQQSYDNQQLQMRLDALEQDSRMRLDTIEGQLRNAPAAAPQPSSAHAPMMQQPQPDPVPSAGMPPAPNAPQAVVTGNETGAVSVDAAALYEQGFAEIKRNDYVAAEKSFANFIKQYPEHALTPNAMYWLGETHYVRKEYDKAARVFAEAYQKYPKGPKGADNLLKLGMSLAGSGKKNDACIALGQLKRQYPDGPAPILNKGDQEMATLGCS